METIPPDSNPASSPPPLPPLAYRGHSPMAPLRPSVVTTLTTLGVVWAVLELIVAVSGLLLPAHRPVTRPTTLPSYSQSPGGNRTVYTYHASYTATVRTRSALVTTYNVARWILAGLLLITSIAARRLRPWGRRGMIIWAWTSLAVVTFELVHGLIFASATLFRGPRRTQIFLVIVYVMILAFQLFPIWILATFNTPRIKSAFGEST